MSATHETLVGLSNNRIGVVKTERGWEHRRTWTLKHVGAFVVCRNARSRRIVNGSCYNSQMGSNPNDKGCWVARTCVQFVVYV